MKKGKAYLVGAGPGDPELLTLKGKRCIESAEVVIYDRLVADDILAMASSNAEMIFVGKEDSFHAVPQEEINRLIADKAKEDKVVVRLKGGDPYIFGRGSEEAELLYNEGIPFEVVPGITAASGIAAYAGIPLTDRRHTSGVSFITGHKRSGEDLSDINWEAYAKSGNTLVFYMGIKNIETIASQLIANGKSAKTPAAVVRYGTRPDQEVVAGALSEIVGLVEKSGIKPPALLIVGEVISLRDSLAWFQPEAVG